MNKIDFIKLFILWK